LAMVCVTVPFLVIILSRNLYIVKNSITMFADGVEAGLRVSG
jgi:hypothetical protein